jgi:hypothetical protein
MSTTPKPALTELAEQVQSIHADLEEVLQKAQSLLHQHLESLEASGDLDEDSFVDFCEKDGYLAFVEALGQLQSVIRELDAEAFVVRSTSSRELVGGPQRIS